MKLEEILDASILIGFHLLSNGADVSRVEQSITYLCSAYGIKESEAFVIPSSIVVTIQDGATSLTKTKRVLTHQINLDRVEKISGLSRYICTARPEYAIIKSRMEEILLLPRFPLKWRYFAHLLTGASFCIFFGGTLFDALAAGLIGLLILFVSNFFERIKANPFFQTIIVSFLIALISRILAHTTQGFFHSDLIIIGDIMLLVPGLALANSMRDFIASDTMTGLSRLTEALFVAIGVALGVAFAMYVY
ncbi:MAG: hypothetical protein PWP24_1498 [Clostridiales bacterium]|nr:hypothetical protein [Clostridiales bacterium]